VATVRITNVSKKSIVVTGWVRSWVTRKGENAILSGQMVIAQAGLPEPYLLRSGKSRDIDVTISDTSLDPALGHVLPQGDYTVRFFSSVATSLRNPLNSSVGIRSPEIPITFSP
jgi:hypothetical protein